MEKEKDVLKMLLMVLVTLVLISLLSGCSSQSNFGKRFHESFYHTTPNYHNSYGTSRGGYYGGTYIPYSKHSVKWR